jgi:hypothetical protein
MAPGPIKKEQGPRKQDWEHGEGQDPMGPASAPGEIGVGAAEVSQYVDIGEVGTNDECRRAESRSIPQAAAGERDPDKGMADRIYSSLASISSWTLPCNAPETGQPFLAASAALAKPD